MIVDAHHHVWDTERRWMTDDVAPLRRPCRLQELRGVAEPAGVTSTVVVEADTSESETRELLALAAASGGFIAAVVGWVDLTAADVAERIAALREGPGGNLLVGFRHHVQDEPADWLVRDDVLRGLRAVAAAGLRYDLLIRPRHLRAAARAAALVEHLPVVVDHGAKPGIAAGAWEPWSDDLAALASVERVHCKLSGLVTEADWARWRGDGVERYAVRLLELFGPARLMFGSDWPVCTLAATYAEVLDLACAAIGDLNPSERDAVLAGTARSFYGLDEEDG